MNTDSFALRHIGPRPEKVAEMLHTIGVDSLDQLIYETLPDGIKLEKELSLAPAISEQEYLAHNQILAEKNKIYKTYIGLGYSAAILPPVIQRNIFENPGWYTAYTPYQAEVAQGRLEALLNFQTMVADLTGMEIANASLLDEGTAASEAMGMFFATRSRQQKKDNVVKFFVSEEILPQTLAVLETRAYPLGIELVIGNHEDFDFSEDFFGAILQYPGTSGKIYNYHSFTSNAYKAGIKVVIAADILSLVKLEAPGNFGVDAVVGTTQRFGIPLGYGGPHAAYFATKESYKRNLPGRIIGITKDKDGNRAVRMALQTREQHIKRDKATSNICTAQVLLAVMAGMYAVYHGPEGLKHIANKVHNSAVSLSQKLEELGYQQLNNSYFDTIRIKADSTKIQEIALANEINFYYPSKDTVSITLNETTTLEDLNNIIRVFAEAAGKETITLKNLTEGILDTHELARTSPFLTNEVFNAYHSETELMRYLKKLERKDLALNHSMIALGSCTMKLNAAAEMLPLSNPKWGNIHPFAPTDQAEGYHQVLKGLEDQLTEITGFYATSLQPNSGAQGEYAGLMTIRKYHDSRGDQHRNICLIPSSAHGTNPASAVMAGMKVVVTKSTDKGNIDVDDLREKAEKYKDSLAALMVTYPSTHGVFESAIKEITQIIHDNGGKVYMDGANMNAQVGITNPGRIGADVCHLNLHKTFAIPHGGGGPGVGPICVVEDLAPYLPTNPLVQTGGNTPLSAISSAPWGSALVCLIPYAYIRMLGAKGLKHSTQMAILNTNYIKERLKEHYEILYSGEMGRAAHEMIIDIRPLKDKNIEVADVAKRLIDYGFHAPTVSFPVAGTLMVEPTESESKAELDRFCDAMIAIKAEYEAIEDEENNLLKNAPHTQKMLTADEWNFPYSRKQAAYPLPYLEENKFWASVRRVDEAFGDRNLMCTCAPIEEYIDADA
ncbi:MAG: aminomethyl-transferring glycine dehydrogenase [Mesonia hippocampi]|uniref:aminomethyl-transferring glycine dehydrogenase n=1 Tax=Mesonia hippocampi TaxID=1628250 RepID=UPI003F9A7D8B